MVSWLPDAMQAALAAASRLLRARYRLSDIEDITDYEARGPCGMIRSGNVLAATSVGYIYILYA